MENYLVLTHAQLEATRMMLWSLALEREAEGEHKDRDILLDAMDLVGEELIKIELSSGWAQHLEEGK